MKKPTCARGAKCSEWMSNLLHAIVFTHGPEISEALQSSEKRQGDRSPPTKKRAVESQFDKETKEFLEQKYLVSFPDEFLRFWELVSSFQNQDYYSIFKSLKNLRLFGPFQILYEKGKKTLSYDDEYYLTAHRFSTDLPEMQTVAVYDGGRYVYWRDTPKGNPVFLVHVLHKSEHFPKAEIIGDADPRWIIVHLCASENEKQMLTADKKLRIDLCKVYRKEVNELIKKRSRNSCGQSFHGLGLLVKVKDDVGYRPLENPPPTRLKKILKDFATCTDEKRKNELREEIMSCMTFVDIANDEMDYSLGLEVGHDLFWSNYASVDRLAEITLNNAYTLLERSEFKSILNAHMKVRRANETLNY